MTFAEVLPWLNVGVPVRRAGFPPELIIFKQVPAHIDDVTHMKSIPIIVKEMLLKYGVGIDYEDQYIIYDFETGIATYCVFDGEDINAIDWEVLNSEYNPYV